MSETKKGIIFFSVFLLIAAIFLLPLLIKDMKKMKKLRENGAYTTAIAVSTRTGRNYSRRFTFEYFVDGKKYIARGGDYKDFEIGDSTLILYYVPDPNIAVLLHPGQDSI